MATAKTLQDSGPLLNMPEKEKKSSKQRSLTKNHGFEFSKVLRNLHTSNSIIIIQKNKDM